VGARPPGFRCLIPAPVKRPLSLLGALALACAGSCAGEARAQSEAILVRLELRSPAGCGSVGQFEEQVRRRTTRIRLTTEAEIARALVIVLKPAARGTVRGTATVIEPDGTQRARKLSAKSCDEAIAALALIAVVTLDPEALLAPPPDESAPPPEPPPSAEPPPTPAPAPAPAPPPPAPRAPPASRPDEVGSPSPLRVTIAAQAAASFGVAPQPAWGGALSVALELRPGRVFAPLGRLTVAHTQRRGVTRQAGTANFAFTLPALDLCPVRLGPPALGLRPCGYAALGLLHAWGSATAELEEHRRLSGSGGASLLLGIELSEALEIIADGRGGFAFQRDRFAFDGVGFYRTGLLVFSAGAGLGGRFP
jgi:hypothetical protein